MKELSIEEKAKRYSKLVCEKGHSCENIPYALYPSEIELLHK